MELAPRTQGSWLTMTTNELIGMLLCGWMIPFFFIIFFRGFYKVFDFSDDRGVRIDFKQKP